MRQDGTSYTLPHPDRLTNQDYVRRVLDQIKIGLEPLVEFACRRTSGLDLPATADAMNKIIFCANRISKPSSLPPPSLWYR